MVPGLKGAPAGAIPGFFESWRFRHGRAGTPGPASSVRRVSARKRDATCFDDGQILPVGASPEISSDFLR